MKRSSASRLRSRGVRAGLLLAVGVLSLGCGEHEEPFPSPMQLYVYLINAPQPDAICIDDSLSTPIAAGVPLTLMAGSSADYRYIQGTALSRITFTANDASCDIIAHLYYCDPNHRRKYYDLRETPELSCIPDRDLVQFGTPRVCTISLAVATRILMYPGRVDTSKPCSRTLLYEQL